MLHTIFFVLMNGLVYGLLLFLLSSGLTLIFSMMGVLNFAQASFYMLGAYFGYQIMAWTNFWIALICAPVLVGLLGALVERYVLSKVHARGHVAELLLTFGVSYLVIEMVKLAWGVNAVSYNQPPALNFPLFTVDGVSYPAYNIFMMVVSVLIFVLLFLLLKKTRIGIIIQAALSNRDMVGMLGHNIPRIFALVFGIGCALAGVAGVVGGNILVTEPGMALSIGPIIFVVVVVGGMGSFGGALVASLLIGFLQNYMTTLNVSLAGLVGITPGTQFPLYELLNQPLSQLAAIMPYFLMILILTIRPKGLMGRVEI
jgi:branched-chain amino acid transport system permease protein